MPPGSEMNDLDTFPHLTYEFASNTYLQDFVNAEHLVFCEKAAEPGGEYCYRLAENIPLLRLLPHQHDSSAS